MNTRKMVINTIIAALYVAMTGIFAFMSFGAVQFRVSEMLNHLVGYHKNYKYGVLAGVFIANRHVTEPKYTQKKEKKKIKYKRRIAGW